MDMKAETVQVEIHSSILLVEHFCFFRVLQMESFIRVTGKSLFLGFVLTRENKRLKGQEMSSLATGFLW